MADFCFKKPAFTVAGQQVPTEPVAKRRRQEMPEAGKNIFNICMWAVIRHLNVKWASEE